jgi:hypothetical protein
MVSTVRWSCIGRVTSKLDFSPLPCKTAAIDAQRYQFATKNSTRGAERGPGELGPPPGKGGQSFLRSFTLQGGCTPGRWSPMTLDRLLPFSLALVLLTGCGSGVHSTPPSTQSNSVCARNKQTVVKGTTYASRARRVLARASVIGFTWQNDSEAQARYFSKYLSR